MARCLSGPSAEESLAPCERDIHVGDDLSLSYRFPTELAEGLAGAGRGGRAARPGKMIRTRKILEPRRRRSQARSMSRIAIEKL